MSMQKQIVPSKCEICGNTFQLEQTLVAGAWWPAAGICDACDESKVKSAQAGQKKCEMPIWQRRFFEIAPPDMRILDTRKLPAAYTSTKGELPQASHAAAMKWTPASGKSLLLVGDTGLAKTRTAYAKLAELLKANPTLTVEKFNCISFGEESKARSFTGKGADWFRYLARVPDVIFFDDLFRGILNEQHQEELFALISTRTEEQKLMIATTQFTAATMPQVLKAHHVAAITRRFRDYFTVVPFIKPAVVPAKTNTK